MTSDVEFPPSPHWERGESLLKAGIDGRLPHPLPFAAALMSKHPAPRRIKRPVQAVRSLAAQSGRASPVYQRKEGLLNLPSWMLLPEQAAARPVVPD